MGDVNNCGTCKYWKRDAHPTHFTGKCQRMLINLQAQWGKMVLQPYIWLNGIPEGYCEGSTFSVGENYGCVLWEEIPGPFYVRLAPYCTLRAKGMGRFEKVDFWDVLYEGDSIHSITNEGKARDLCCTLNTLWAGRDE